ncbi:NprX family peptide pheromone [Bacillus sp. TL12]|nr:NprX family peptide pheromone [Bacillus sp. TL12]MCI0766207.1 NprX family peptide pheromone [Bacillus sp. TL12]
MKKRIISAFAVMGILAAVFGPQYGSVPDMYGQEKNTAETVNV